MKKTDISSYLDSPLKRFFDISFSLAGLVILSPLIIALISLLKLINGNPIFFKQKRTGRFGKSFMLIKFRSMRPGAEKEQQKYMFMNEADGPVFKIENDPRLTKLGKYLFKTGLDELPQLINVLRGEMSLVGPRPLPISEAKKLTKSQKIRVLAKPGVTSPWIVEGAHHLAFAKWMELDKDYLKNASLSKDLSILIRTGKLISRSIVTTLLSVNLQFQNRYQSPRGFQTSFWLLLFIISILSGFIVLQNKGINIIDAYTLALTP